MYAETIFLNCTEIMHEKFVKSEQCEIKKRKKNVHERSFIINTIKTIHKA